MRLRRFLWGMAPPALLAILAAIFFHTVLFGGQVLLPTDQLRAFQAWLAELGPPETLRQWGALAWYALAQYYPWRAFLGECLHAGEIPLWNPRELMGTPFLANGQSAVLYPPNWLFALMEPAVAFGWSAWLHFLLGGLFTYWLLRELGAGTVGALAAAVAFMFSGFMVGMCELPTFICVAVWLPAGLACLLRVRRREGALWTVVLGVVIGLAFLAGHLQITAYVMLVLGATMLSLLIISFQRRTFAAPGAFLLRCLGALAIGALLAAPQMLPTYELARISSRGIGKPTMDQFRFHRQRAFTPDQWVLLLSPDAMGNPADGDFAGTYSYGEHCAYGGLLTLLLAGAALLLCRRSATYFFGGLTVGAFLAASGTVVAAALFFFVPGLSSAGGFTRIFCVYNLGLAVLAGLGLDRIAGIIRTRRGEGQAWAIAALLVVIIVLDLFHFGMKFNPTGPRDDVYPDASLLCRLEDAADGSRILAVTETWPLLVRPVAVLPPNGPMVYKLHDVQGYDSLFPAATKRFLAKLEGRDPSPLANGNMVLLHNLDSPLLDEVGCKYVMTLRQLDGDRWVLEDSNGIVNIYRNRNAWPRAYTLSPDTAPHAGPPPERFTLRWTADTVEVKGNASGPSLVLTDTWYPGWKATVNGRLTEVARHDGLFRRVQVPPGQCRVQFVYMPSSFKVGLFLALAGLGICAALGAARLAMLLMVRGRAMLKLDSRSISLHEGT